MAKNVAFDWKLANLAAMNQIQAIEKSGRLSESSLPVSILAGTVHGLPKNWAWNQDVSLINYSHPAEDNDDKLSLNSPDGANGLPTR